MALSHAAGLKTKIAELQAMVKTLEHLAEHCQGNERPECPILADLGEPSAAVELRSAAAHKPPRFGVDKPASSRHRVATVRQS